MYVSVHFFAASSINQIPFRLLSTDQLPDNNALSGLCQGMVEAWKLQGSNKAAILFVIEDVTYNICDQRFHEFEIRTKYPEINVIRKTLTQIHEDGKLGPANELLM